MSPGLMLALQAIGWGLVLPWATWIFYGHIMNLRRVRDAGKLTGGMAALGLPTLWLGLVLDVLLNVVVLSILMLEMPREWLVTHRLSRLQASTATGRLARWRRWLARLVCAQLLDALDPSGCHCK